MALAKRCSRNVGARRAALFLGIPVLIQSPEHIEGFAVKQEAPVLRLESAEPHDPLDRVDGRVADDKFDDEIVKDRRFGRPGLSPGKGEYRVKAAQSKVVDRARGEFAAARKRDLQCRRSGGAR